MKDRDKIVAHIASLIYINEMYGHGGLTYDSATQAVLKSFDIDYFSMSDLQLNNLAKSARQERERLEMNLQEVGHNDRKNSN